MDILNAGIVHSSGTAGLWIQRTFKHSAEDGRTDCRPVKIFAGTTQQKIDDFITQAWNFDVLIGKQAAVDVGKRRQIFIQITVSLFRFLVEYME